MTLWRYGLASVLSFGAAWYVQGGRWDADVAKRERQSAEAIAANVAAVNDHLIESRKESEQIRATFIEYKKGAESEISSLEQRVTTGPDRLYIKAKCPAVPPAGADSSRVNPGAAELDATATGYYFALERGLAEQYGLLQMCRSELKKRSAP